MGDDTFMGLARQHGVVVDWIDWHDMRLHSGKTELVVDCGGPGSADEVKNEEGSGDVIAIEGSVLPVRCRTDTVGYLGAVGCVAMTGDAQLMALRRRCGWYAHAIIRHHMRPDRALLVVNKHLIPAISYSIRSLCCKRADVCALDKMVARAVSCGGAGSVRAVAPAVLACITGMLLPSVEEAVIKIGETFLRLNGARPALARQCWLDVDKPRSRVPRNKIGRAHV